ncbi:type 1 glutamine amidotransferase domain-containing protein [Botrimarina sp.]|uniref:type 1 glutamine amidotransferase domain-containing protein n=1 Tax=Botrimarina sp. TaxID=2795802 RepID=UPI0032EB3636
MSSPTPIKNKRVAFLAAKGFEQIELVQPWQAVEAAGGAPHLVSLESGKITGAHHDKQGDEFTVDKTVDEVTPDDYDALVLPGGVFNPDALRQNEKAVRFVRGFFEQHKPVAAICHGPWMLAEAGVVDGRKVTSYPSIKTDLINAGANWVDEECVCDEGLVTSRRPSDLPAFCDKLVEEIAEGKHAAQVA